MTLPFRRRHHDDEASHDRARALVSIGFLEPLADADATWLDGHLDRCAECRAERDALVSDRALLRSLRDRMPEPPRDLWARTAAAIESRQKPRQRRLLGLGTFPAAAMSAALVVLVVVGTTLLVPNRPLPPTGTPPVARASTTPGPTPLEVEAARVAWFQTTSDGSFGIVFAEIDQVCGQALDCAPLADSSPAPLKLAAPPQDVVLSPGRNQVAVVGSASETSGSVTIVDVPVSGPGATPPPSGTAAPEASPTTTSSAQPEIGHVIVRGVVVVGSIGYSADGRWLAFSAKPRHGGRGADLYVWHTGDAEARRVTDDGATYFSGWFGDSVLASTITTVELVDGASPSPDVASPTPDGSSAPTASGARDAPAAAVGHPTSFLLDPSTGERTQLRGSTWRPSIDPTGRFVTYWSGTLVPADPAVTPPFEAGTIESWQLGSGELVLDGWSEALPPMPSPAASSEPETIEPAASEPAVSAEPESGAASGEPPADVAGASGDPAAAMPAGTPISLTSGPIADFDARFDPSGSRLAIWVLDAPDASAGRLWLVVLDPAMGTISPTLDPMGAPGVQAVRGFTIERGRLAWVTPTGQDGQPSSIQVLAWQGDEFGQVESRPGGNVQIIR